MPTISRFRRVIWGVFLAYFTVTTPVYAATDPSELASNNVDFDCEDIHLFSSRLITDINWEQASRISIAGVKFGSWSDPPGSTSQKICSCNDDGIPKPGFVTAQMEPARLFENQRTPGCFSSLGGTKVPMGVSDMFRGTTSDGAHDLSDKTYLHYHLFAFPLLILMNLLTIASTNKDGINDFDLLLISEVDPAHARSDFAVFIFPETIFMASLIVACPVDAVASSNPLTWPINSLKWCYGSWGAAGVPSGHHTGGAATIEEHSMSMARAIAVAHRRGMMRRTMGDDALCKGKITAFMPKTQYTFTTFNPLPEADSYHVLGQSTLTWGNARLVLGMQNTPVSVIWRRNESCVF